MINSTQCYIRQGEQVLMLHRVKKKQDINRDKWIAPGGKFEEGESPEDCMRREVLEETGLTVTGWRYRGLVTFVMEGYGTEYMHLFTVHSFTGRLQDCDEGELAWLRWDALPELPIWEGDKIFLRLLDRERPFFSLKLCYSRDNALTRAVLDGEELPLA